MTLNERKSINFFRKAKIVILDEATSSLDSSLDKKIQDCLSEALADSTVILIAHRLENVLRLDKILYMDQAKVNHGSFLIL